MPKEGPLGERTEPATPKRRQQAIDEGNTCQSKDLAQAMVLLLAFIFLHFYGSWAFHQLREFTIVILSGLHQVSVSPDGHLAPFSPDDFIAWGYETMWQITKLLLPFWIVVFLVGLGTVLFQVGFVFTLKPLTKFDLNRFNPINGIKRLLFSLRSLMKLLFSILKLVAISVLLYYTLKDEVVVMAPLMEIESVAVIGSYMWALSFEMAVKVAALLVILAIFDYMYQKWQYEEDLKMSKKEVEDEMKTMEGDPKIKGKRREIQRKLALARMMAKVPEADVVITNPTELAVAVKYEDHAPAPIVLAKGAGKVAERIREIAAKNGVPIIEKKPLAQALFRAVEVGEFVPENLWEAIAEVLAYVYELDEMKRRRFAERSA